MKYMLDTDTASYLIRGEKALVSKAMSKLGSWCVSSITASELSVWLFGDIRPDLEERILQFLEGTDVIPFGSQDAMELGRMRSRMLPEQRAIQNMDGLIAAHAISRQLILVTNNTKDFDGILDLEIENWAV